VILSTNLVLLHLFTIEEIASGRWLLYN